MLRALREQNKIMSGNATVGSYSSPDVTSIIRGSIKDPSATNTTDIVSNKRFQNVLKTLSTRGSVDDIVDAARACASVATYISKKFG